MSRTNAVNLVWLRLMLVLSAAWVPASWADVRIQGAGATFPKALYLRWASDYGTKHPGSQVEYQSQGSGFGINGITNRTIDFGATDAPMNKKEREKLPAPVLHIPTCGGAVVAAYNVPGLGGELKLSGPVLAEIYLGNISKWNDTAIAELNPGAKLPDLAITPVARSDASGTTFVFTSYLATQSDIFKQTLGIGKSVEWKKGQQAKGNEGVSNQIRQIAGAIGYVELNYAIVEKLPHAAIKNTAGEFVAASPASVTAAATGAESRMKEVLATNIWNSSNPGAYPISALTYMLVYQDLGYLKDKAKAEEVVGYMAYCLTAGQPVAPTLDYASLPDGVRARALAALGSVVFDGSPLEAATKAGKQDSK